jgi:hypothetical protein
MGEMLLLAIQLLVSSLLIFSAHALRRRIGLGPFYALLGAITAVMSWVTDAGLAVRLAGITFVVGSTAFYTSLLLGVFVVYVSDGPRPTRFAILTVAVISALTPLTAAVLHLQARLGRIGALAAIPLPSLRINAASVLTTLIDLIFLAMAWEFLGKPRLHRWLRVYLTLLGVMWLDVALFATGAFAGTPEYLSIMSGTLISRLLTSLFALLLLAGYLSWQSRWKGLAIENRPVLAILARVAEVEAELTQAQREIQRRQEAEKKLRQALSEVKTLRGLLPICSHCKRIRDDKGYWNSIEQYLQEHSEALLSHGICPDCLEKHYPDVRLPPEE